MVIGDQVQRRQRAQERAGLGGQRVVLEHGAQERVGLGRRPVLEHAARARCHPPELERRRTRRALADVAARLVDRRRVQPAVAAELCLEPLAQRGRIRLGLLERLPAEREGPVEAPAQPERAGAAQGDRPALDGGGGDGDCLVQQVELIGVRVHVGRQREAQLEPHVGVVGGVRRWLGDRAAEVGRRALWSAARAGPPRSVAQHRDRGRVPGRLGAQQVQTDALGVGALAREQRGGVRVLERPLAGRQARVQRSRDQRVRERQPRTVREQAGGPQRVGGAGRLGELEPGKRGGVAQRSAGAEHGNGAGQRPGAVRQPRELALDDPRNLLGAERPQPRRGLVVRGDASATSWVSRAPSRNGLPPVTAWHACANPALAAGRRSRTNVSVAAGPSARGRTGGSGALASNSASSSGAAAGSPERTAQTRAIRSSPSERASSASQRSDGASAQWTSSTTSTAGPRSARLLASQTSPRTAACIASPACAGSPASGASARSASPAAPTVNSSHSGRASQRLEELARHAPGGVLLERAAERAKHRRAIRARDPARGREQR